MRRILTHLRRISCSSCCIWQSWGSLRAAGSQLVMDPRTICKKTKRLRGKMAEICSKQALVDQIRLGVELGQRECQYQFRFRRWNCTSSRKSIRKVLLRDTRETGFVNAVLAAGVTYQVTRACTTGELLGCSCDRKMKSKKNKKRLKMASMPEGDWEWEACGGENIDFGLKKSKDFLDTRYKKRSDMKTLVKLHNYVAGRMAIKNHMRTECKCHGLSGSCTLKTCWRKMPPFREVGNRLKERFDGAVKVIAGNDGQSFMPEDSSIKPPGKTGLVYSEESPHFCLPNNTLGSFGTQGRTCVETSPGEEGCSILCCGRGSRSHDETEEKNCKCKFLWCCEVKCEKCNETRTISTCL
ncbi:wnt6 protein isoform X1 [Tribolium castaneum]|uniref:wnt6 protein isoform X1 n=1 Tax=Tribolium castaneum TaxID=7070 RepID=UPI00077DBD22|nr:PREDICTED: wnt6 protein isoform X1 [Tribolium castaneum]|eukprot:XP_015835201.1 PREDICTED: wnt6 protein isoform X1 [Tribolium castaneum]